MKILFHDKFFGGERVFKSKNVDIIGGPIAKSMVIYAIPIILGALIQVAFNAADLMVVGKMGGLNSSAAVGAVAPIVNLCVSSFIGLSVGINAVLARSLGQRDKERTSKVVNTSIIFAAGLGLFLVLAFFLFSGPLLKVVNCDEDYIAGAELYLKIYAIGVPAILVYNFASSIIRSMGDTTSPFIYLVISGASNVVLNLLLCMFMDNKVAAVAIATTVSQLIGAILTFVHLVRLDSEVAFNIKKLSFSFSELWAILKVGMPSAFNSALFSLSNLQMHSAINSYGPAATAGNGAATNLETLCSAFATGFNVATVSFVGQNVAANNPTRVKKSIFSALVISTSVAFVVSMLLYIFAEYALWLYLPDSADGAAGITYGFSRMKYVCRFYTVAALSNIIVSSLQAFGYSFIPMINSIITVLCFRIFWLEVIYPRLDAIEHTIDNVYVCFTISWILSLLAHMVMFTIIYSKYRKGKVRKI